MHKPMFVFFTYRVDMSENLLRALRLEGGSGCKKVAGFTFEFWDLFNKVVGTCPKNDILWKLMHIVEVVQVSLALTIGDIISSLAKVVSPSYIGTIVMRWRQEEERDYLIVIFEEWKEQVTLTEALSLLNVEKFARVNLIDGLYGLKHLKIFEQSNRFKVAQWQSQFSGCESGQQQ